MSANIGWDLNPFKAIKKVAKTTGGFVDDVVKSSGKAIQGVSSVANELGGAIKGIPVIGKPFHAVYNAGIASQFKIASDITKGKRIDRVAMGHFKSQLKDAKTIGPYAQTVASFVPGVGTGVSGALGAGLALADGKPIDAALVAGVRGAVPGGPAGQAAFDVAVAGIEGKPIDTVAVNALPIPKEQKKYVLQAVRLTKDIAEGKNVSEAVINRGLKALPKEQREALQIGIAIAQGKNLQKAILQGASAAIKKLEPIGAKTIATDPRLREGLKIVGTKASFGYRVGMGAMSLKQNPASIRAIRSKLNPAQQKGFDVALAASSGLRKKPSKSKAKKRTLKFWELKNKLSRRRKLARMRLTRLRQTQPHMARATAMRAAQKAAIIAAHTKRTQAQKAKIVARQEFGELVKQGSRKASRRLRANVKATVHSKVAQKEIDSNFFKDLWEKITDVFGS